jgi:hypothetical protein
MTFYVAVCQNNKQIAMESENEDDLNSFLDEVLYILIEQKRHGAMIVLDSGLMNEDAALGIQSRSFKALMLDAESTFRNPARRLWKIVKNNSLTGQVKRQDLLPMSLASALRIEQSQLQRFRAG